MAVWDTIRDYLGNYINFGSLNFSTRMIVSVGSGIIVFVILFWILVRRASTDYIPMSEKRALRGLGSTPLDVEGHTGRSVLRTFRRGLSGSAMLAGLALKAGKRGGKLVRDSSRYVQKLIKGEEENIAIAAHEASSAAASLDLSSVIRKFADSELREHDAMQEIGEFIRAWDDRLGSITDAKQIDEEGRVLAVEAGSQITSSLVLLARHKSFEISLRKKTFNDVGNNLRVISVAESHAKKIESMAIRNQRSLGRYTQKRSLDIETDIKKKVSEAEKKLREAEAAYASTDDRETQIALYKQIALEQQNIAQVKSNAQKLLEMSQLLRMINWRALKAFTKIRKDIKNALSLVQDAMSKESALIAQERSIGQNSSSIREASKSAEENLKMLSKESPETIIIGLTRDCGLIMAALAEISKQMSEVDKNQLMPLLESLSNAMQVAYRVEEASRVANAFYVKLIKANEDFLMLVANADFSGEIKENFVHELEIEKMEEKIANAEQSVSSASKSLFIKANHILQSSMTAVVQHIEYLNNNVQLMTQTKSYTLGVLKSIMEKLLEHKFRVNSDISEEIKKSRQGLQEAEMASTVIKTAA